MFFSPPKSREFDLTFIDEDDIQFYIVAIQAMHIVVPDILRPPMYRFIFSFETQVNVVVFNMVHWSIYNIAEGIVQKPLFT